MQRLEECEELVHPTYGREDVSRDANEQRIPLLVVRPDDRGHGRRGDRAGTYPLVHDCSCGVRRRGELAGVRAASMATAATRVS